MHLVLQAEFVVCEKLYLLKLYCIFPFQTYFTIIKWPCILGCAKSLWLKHILPFPLSQRKYTCLWFPEPISLRRQWELHNSWGATYSAPRSKLPTGKEKHCFLLFFFHITWYYCIEDKLPRIPIYQTRIL